MSELYEMLTSQLNFYAEKGADSVWIEQAEASLKLKFALDYTEYLREFGAVSYGGHELTGFSADKELDVIEVTKRNWKKNHVEETYYVIEEAHIDGIVIWQDTDGKIYESSYSNFRKIANSLLEYIVNCN